MTAAELEAIRRIIREELARGMSACTDENGRAKERGREWRDRSNQTGSSASRIEDGANFDGSSTTSPMDDEWLAAMRRGKRPRKKRSGTGG